MSMGLVVRLVELGYSTTTGSSVTKSFKNLCEWVRMDTKRCTSLASVKSCTVAGAGPVCSSLFTEPHISLEHINYSKPLAYDFNAVVS